MWDRQYCISIAVFAFAAIAILGGIVSLLFWLGWPGLMGLVVLTGTWLAWFYWGSRPDLNPRDRDDELHEPDNV